MALTLRREPTIAVLVRLPEPGESQRESIGIETDAENVLRDGTGVLIRHEDGDGYAFYPWARIIRIDYRAEPDEPVSRP